MIFCILPNGNTRRKAKSTPVTAIFLKTDTRKSSNLVMNFRLFTTFTRTKSKKRDLNALLGSQNEN